MKCSPTPHTHTHRTAGKVWPVPCAPFCPWAQAHQTQAALFVWRVVVWARSVKLKQFEWIRMIECGRWNRTKYRTTGALHQCTLQNTTTRAQDVLRALSHKKVSRIYCEWPAHQCAHCRIANGAVYIVRCRPTAKRDGDLICLPDWLVRCMRASCAIYGVQTHSLRITFGFISITMSRMDCLLRYFTHLPSNIRFDTPYNVS